MTLSYSSVESKIRSQKARRRQMYERLLLRRLTGWALWHIYMAIMALIGHILLFNLICTSLWK